MINTITNPTQMVYFIYISFYMLLLLLLCGLWLWLGNHSARTRIKISRQIANIVKFKIEAAVYI